MAVQTYEGQFMTGVGGPGTNIAITGLPFTPECVIFFSVGEPDAVERTDWRSADAGWGVALSASSRRCLMGRFVINISTTGSCGGNQIRNDAVYATLSGVGATVGLLDLTSMDANGFTVTIDASFVATRCVHYIAIRGYSHYALGDSAIPGATGIQAIAGLGFRPCGELFGLQTNSNLNTAQNVNPNWAIGAAVDASHQGQVSAGGIGIGAFTWVAKRYQTATECMSAIDPVVGVTNRATFVSQDVDGFTVNWLERNAAFKWFWLAFGGPDGSVFVGNLTTRADGNDIPVGTGFYPSGLLFFSDHGPLSAPDTTDGGARLSFGGASSPAQRSVVSEYAEDAVVPTDVDTQQYLSEVYASATAAAAVDGLMDVKSFDPAGFTAVMDDVDAGTTVVFIVAFGPANWESRKRVVTYTRDTTDSDPRLKDANGVYLDPWECHSDAWVKFLGVFSPTPNVPSSLVDDPEAGYIEEMGWESDSDEPKYFTSRMDLGETVIAQAASKAAG